MTDPEDTTCAVCGSADRKYYCHAHEKWVCSDECYVAHNTQEPHGE